MQRTAGIRWAWAAVVVGIALSWWLASPELAFASAVAFGAAEAVDLAVYTRLRSRFVIAVLVSNIVAAPIDTVLFLHLAGFPVTTEAVAGQFIGKVVWATLIPLALYLIGRHALLRKPGQVAKGA